MSTATDTDVEAEREEPVDSGDLFLQASLAGVAAGIVFGLLIQFALGRMTFVGALFVGRENLVVGWAGHLLNSTVFALVYALLTRVESLSRYADRVRTGVAPGAVFGVALWFVNIGFVWPIWLNAVGVTDLPVPYLGALGPLAGHLLWGALLGALFPLLRRR